MVKFSFLIRRVNRLTLSKELAAEYLSKAPLPEGIDERIARLLRPIIERERATKEALKDAMAGYATYSDTLAYLLTASLSGEPDEDIATIIAWLQRKVLGEKAVKTPDVPEILPKALEDKLNRIRSQVLMDQMRRAGLT